MSFSQRFARLAVYHRFCTLESDRADGVYLWMALTRREWWHRDSSPQKQPMLMGVRAATCATNATVCLPSALDNSSRS